MIDLTNPRSQALILTSLEASLENAEESVTKATAEFNQAHTALENAKSERDEYKQLIENINQLSVDSDVDKLDDSDADIDVDDAQPQRANISRYNLLIPILLREKGLFSTTDEIVSLVQASFPERQIKKKTVQNALSLNSSNEEVLKVKQENQYLWGFKDWLNISGLPLPEHLP